MGGGISYLTGYTDWYLSAFSTPSCVKRSYPTFFFLFKGWHDKESSSNDLTSLRAIAELWQQFISHDTSASHARSGMLSTYPPTCVKEQFPGAVIWKCAEQIWKVTRIRRGTGARRGRQLSTVSLIFLPFIYFAVAQSQPIVIY